jgi:hypothetical protein
MGPQLGTGRLDLGADDAAVATDLRRRVLGWSKAMVA